LVSVAGGAWFGHAADWAGVSGRGSPRPAELALLVVLVGVGSVLVFREDPYVPGLVYLGAGLLTIWILASVGRIALPRGDEVAWRDC
jgi:hypothetical protein